MTKEVPQEQGPCRIRPEDHFGLVYKIAHDFWAPHDPAVDFADLIGAAMVGLLEATRRHDPKRGPFGVFARKHIRGAIHRQIERSRAACAPEMLTRVPLADLEEILDAPGAPRVLYGNGQLEPDVEDAPAELSGHWRAVLAAVVAEASPGDLQAALMRYVWGCSWPEIGREMGLRADAARKRVARTVGRLRSRFPEWVSASVHSCLGGEELPAMHPPTTGGELMPLNYVPPRIWDWRDPQRLIYTGPAQVPAPLGKARRRGAAVAAVPAVPRRLLTPTHRSIPMRLDNDKPHRPET